ncbi:MAG TPA: FAD-binding protein [Alphaproteobacteria bacterium]|jgi:succinate dehydrogenase/fumarate reductase flavoprotein subunit
MSEKTLPSDIEVIDANVLVIGGGFGGTWAALRASELTDGIVLVEKARVSRSGASTMSGGVTSCPLDSDDLDAWADEFIVRGGYTSDQDWTRQLLLGQRERVKDLIRWNVPITRDEKGEIRRFVSRGMGSARVMQFNPKLAMEEMRRQVEAKGVRILDRIYISELLTADGKWPTQAGVIGAIGFHVRTGKCVVLRAKRTIMATGMIGMKTGMHRVDNDTGDGAAMAYRAGARLVDLEFVNGGTFSIGMKKYKLSSYNVAVAHGAWLINAQGERFMEKYDPVRYERSELPFVIAAFAKEIIDGRGPCYLDLRKCDESYWRTLPTLGRGGVVLLSDEIPDPKIYPMLIEPTFGIWTSDGRGGIWIDKACHTNVPGLLAAGAVAKNLAIGTHGSAGAPTAFAMVSGWHAGDTAGQESLAADPPALPVETILALRERMFAPLGGAKGRSSDSLHDQLAEFECALIENIVLSDASLRARLAAIDKALAAIDQGVAADLHELVKLHEARNVAECTKLIYLSALDRTESREQFYREDHPYTDDEDWLCWHGVRRGGQGALFDRARIPFDKWKIKPVKSERHLSPIAALMRDCYDPAVHNHSLRPVAGGAVQSAVRS